jgi:hypothetical protein
MFQMGKKDTEGVIEVSDLAFDVADVLPGTILVENNISGPKPGDVGLWDSHFRAGGTIGSAVETKCASYPKSDIPGCKAAFLFLHLRPESSTYMESVWGWSVNRDLDGMSGATNGTSQSIAVGRGMLVESTRGTWLVGTAFEHFVLYQYQFLHAKNVFASMAQTETVYWQPAPPAPAPWTCVYQSFPLRNHEMRHLPSDFLGRIQSMLTRTTPTATTRRPSASWDGLYESLADVT